MPISVAIVEDSAAWIEELEQVIARDSGLQLTCTCRRMRSALERIPPLAPDVVLMDINLPDGSGIEATARLKDMLPRIEVLIFTVYEDTEEIFKALEAGASGYLLKRSSDVDVLNAIHNLMKGEVPMTGEIARKIIQSFQKKQPIPREYIINENLTRREMDILQALARGLSMKEIGRECSISPGTVNCHLKNIYAKLHVHSRMEAVMKFLGDPHPLTRVQM
ncbi:response regulator transcription factor [Termitidicoccus mucosus]